MAETKSLAPKAERRTVTWMHTSIEMMLQVLERLTSVPNASRFRIRRALLEAQVDLLECDLRMSDVEIPPSQAPKFR